MPAWLATRSLQPELASSETSTRYPVTADPPLLAGADHVTSIPVCPFALAESSCTAPGTAVATVPEDGYASLVNASSVPSSSVKLAFTLRCLPASASASV